jgi:antitoxin HicB
MSLRYAVVLEPDDNNTILVTVPDLPEAITFGEDRDDAMIRAVDAIETALIARIAAREDIPSPKTTGATSVALPALSSAKVELYRLMRRQNVGKAELSRCLGVALPQIDRLLDLRHNSRLDALDRAFHALGHTMDLRIRKVA